ncbi:MAG: RraA family protein [Anaerolineae bacterium]
MTLPEGWHIVSEIPRPPEELLSRFRGLGSGPVCDALGRFAAMDYQIKPLHPDMELVGPALTVWTRPCDNLAIYRALEMAQPNDVLVIATYGYTTNSVWGELTTLIARARGLAGMVTDGLVRDSREIIDIKLPVFARGLTPNSPFKDGPARINLPVVCGGVNVQPGDILVGDADGVVVVPQGQAASVLERVAAIYDKEAAIRAEIEAGAVIPANMARLLREKGL